MNQDFFTSAMPFLLPNQQHQSTEELTDWTGRKCSQATACRPMNSDKAVNH